jgi:hypothetical protein
MLSARRAASFDHLVGCGEQFGWDVGFVGATTALETWSFPDRVTNEYHLAEVFVKQLPQQGRSRKKVKFAKKQKSKAGKRAAPKGKRSPRKVRRRSK